MKIDIQHFENNVRDNATYIKEHCGNIKEYYTDNLMQNDRDISAFFINDEEFQFALDNFDRGSQEQRDEQVCIIQNFQDSIEKHLSNYDMDITEFLNK